MCTMIRVRLVWGGVISEGVRSNVRSREHRDNLRTPFPQYSEHRPNGGYVPRAVMHCRWERIDSDGLCGPASRIAALDNNCGASGSAARQ